MCVHVYSASIQIYMVCLCNVACNIYIAVLVVSAYVVASICAHIHLFVCGVCTCMYEFMYICASLCVN